ncbi:MAG TPA: cation diffusion facilitator family transporter [Azospirillaceae bacterium]|nr:cation diffusion facilitator family transporter [Azospirillaceae bacterium]
MKTAPGFEFPPDMARQLHKARRLEWLSLLYVGSAAALLWVTMGSSQAMRTGFFDDLISLVPAIAFLVCTRIAPRTPDQTFPYGYHGVVSIGYLTASLALVAMGLFLLIEAVAKFALGERTTIGGMHLFGHTVWAGWPMLVALAYSSIPSFFLGRAKLRLGPKIHDKILFADAQMMKADWMVGVATAIGVLGVGFGYWWMDPLAAAVASFDILKDGFTNVGVAVADLMERRPRKTDRSGDEPLPDEIRRRMEDLAWVRTADVRLREVGHVFFGEVFVVPRDGVPNLPARIREAVDMVKGLNWRVHDVTVTALDRPLEPQAEGSTQAPPERLAARGS